jgi:glycosyltransferase involved in cell wall biosynthesis
MLAWSNNWRKDKRCHIIYNGILSNSFSHTDQRRNIINELNLPDEALLFVHVGRFDVQKNHKRLVEIFEAIAQQVDHAYLLVVGNYQTEHAQTVLPAIEKSAYKNRIMLLGLRTDVPEILAGCDALIFPSLWEGMPGVVLEACAAGLPSVVSDLPGCVEIQQHIDVHILKLTDANETWAKKCIQVAQDANTQRESLRQQFTQSPCNLTDNESVTTLKALWSE